MHHKSKITLATPPVLTAWEETTSAEAALLVRVENQVLAFNAGREPPPSKAQHKGVWAIRLAYWSALCACGVFGAIWWMQNHELAPLQTEGSFVFHSPTKTPQKADPTRSAAMTLSRDATVRDPQGWQLRSHNRAKLRITRDVRQALIHLRRGAVAIHVTPGTMKRFAVACGKDLQVVVKGTKFFVWRSKSGIRVEVTRGHVLLQRKGDTLLHLHKGQGVHLRDASNDVYQSYQIPRAHAKHKESTRDWLATIEYLARSQPAQLFEYARALVKDGLLTAEQAPQILETTAHALMGAKQWSQASRIWRQAYEFQSNNTNADAVIAAQTALYQAAQSCRHSSRERALCARIFQRFLTQYKRSSHKIKAFQEASLFWLATLRLQQRSPRPHVAKTLLQQYIKAHPKGFFYKRALRIIASLSHKK